jgi:hypothetical protein
MKMFSWSVLETVVIEGFEYFMGTQDRRRALGYGPNAWASEIEPAIRKLLNQGAFWQLIEHQSRQAEGTRRFGSEPNALKSFNLRIPKIDRILCRSLAWHGSLLVIPTISKIQQLKLVMASILPELCVP